MSLRLERMKSYMFGFWANSCKQKPDIYRCIRSSCDTHGLYAEIQICFGTVRNTSSLKKISIKKIIALQGDYFVDMEVKIPCSVAAGVSTN